MIVFSKNRVSNTFSIHFSTSSNDCIPWRWICLRVFFIFHKNDMDIPSIIRYNVSSWKRVLESNNKFVPAYGWVGWESYPSSIPGASHTKTGDTRLHCLRCSWIAIAFANKLNSGSESCVQSIRTVWYFTSLYAVFWLLQPGAAGRIALSDPGRDEYGGADFTCGQKSEQN